MRDGALVPSYDADDMATKRRTSGPTQPEHERTRHIFAARLDQDFADLIRAIAKRDGLTIEGLLREAIDARETRRKKVSK